MPQHDLKLTFVLIAIKGLGSAMVEATVDIYQTITVELLPIPAKSHYTFNVRDLAKVFQGVSMASPERTLLLPL